MKKKNQNGLSNQKPVKDEFSSSTKKEYSSKHKDKAVEDPDLSHNELIEKLDTYSKTNIEENVDDYFAFQRMKDKYMDEIKQKDADRIKGAVHYAQGQRAGLPQADYDTLKQGHELQDQNLRNNVVREAGEYYKKNNNLNKIYNKESQKTNEPDQSKDKGLDIEK